MPIRMFFTLLFLWMLKICQCGEPVSSEFSNNQSCFDLSQYNFKQGRNRVYEYRLTARPTRQVQLYIFTNNRQKYTLEVFDGANDSAVLFNISTANILQNTVPVENPEPILSTNGQMFIRITPDTSNMSAVVEFQAMATDLPEPTDGCSPRVINVNSQNMYTMLNFTVPRGGNCRFIIHANDLTNNPLLTQYIQNPGLLTSSNFDVLKGLGDDDFLVRSSSSMKDVFYSATDKYIAVDLYESVNLIYKWTFLESLDINIKVNQFGRGTLITSDFGHNPNAPDNHKQTFTIDIIPPATVVHFTFLSLLGSGLVAIDNGHAGYPYPDYYNAVNGSHWTFNGYRKLILTYTNNNTRDSRGSGFYATFNDVTDYSLEEEDPVPTKVPEYITTRQITTTPLEGTVSLTATTSLKSTESVQRSTLTDENDSASTDLTSVATPETQKLATTPDTSTDATSAPTRGTTSSTTPTTKAEIRRTTAERISSIITTSKPTSDITSEASSTPDIPTNQSKEASTSTTEKPQENEKKSANNIFVCLLLLLLTQSVHWLI